MIFSPQLLTLAHYLAGEFDNREQALNEPAWYVHLRMWQRPVPGLWEDSLALFAEQANILNINKPYRQRIMRLVQGSVPDTSYRLQYYMLKNPDAWSGAGCNPHLLQELKAEQLDILPGCVLTVKHQEVATNREQFVATPPPEARCCFTYEGNTIQVSLGFKVSAESLKSYDKGIDPESGKATWGAVMGPYCYTKREQYKL